jgi:uncharacterized Tic20 family protein
MSQNKENTNAFLIHASSILGYLFPFGSILLPLIIWKTQKIKNDFIEHHGKEAVNFNISYTLYKLVLSAALIPSAIGHFTPFFEQLESNNFDFNYGYNCDFENLFAPVGLLSILGLFGIIRFAITIVASLKSQKGELYTYPLTIKFIK